MSHQLSTVIDVDAIHFILNGKVAESGSHEELVSRRGLYHEMWVNQTG